MTELHSDDGTQRVLCDFRTEEDCHSLKENMKNINKKTKFYNDVSKCY